MEVKGDATYLPVGFDLEGPSPWLWTVGRPSYDLCAKFLVSKMELLVVLYQRVGIRRNEGDGFTTGRDPTGGVLKHKYFSNEKLLFKYLTFFNKDIEISFFRRKCFYKAKDYP